jgi:hypothetical protein
MLAQEGHAHAARENRPQTGKASSDAERNWRPAAEEVLPAVAASAGNPDSSSRLAGQREVPPVSRM